MDNLKPYIVGGNDMVAASSPEQAIQILMAHTGFNRDDYYDECVEDVSHWLGEMIRDEDGVDIQKLSEFIDGCNGVPQYLYGWE